VYSSSLNFNGSLFRNSRNFNVENIIEKLSTQKAVRTSYFFSKDFIHLVVLWILNSYSLANMNIVVYICLLDNILCIGHAKNIFLNNLMLGKITK